MQETQTKARGQGSGSRNQNSPFPIPHSPFRTRPAFTLTELLVVIAIIAVLAGLIAAAAVNALENANRNRIALEIRNISASIEEFKNDYGAYPPNCMNPNPMTSPTPGTAAAYVQSDIIRMFKKAFPRHQEPQALIEGLAGLMRTGSNAILPNGPVEQGLTAAEAMYFWLGGFSADEQYPISGPGGPSFDDADGDNDGNLEASDEQLESRNRRYEFDLTRLGPRNDEGMFDESRGRSIEYFVDLNHDNDVDDAGEERRINLWRYTPSGSEQPLVYFDTSRYKPAQYDLWAGNPTGSIPMPWIVAFKQRRSGAAAIGGSPRNVIFVNQGKFQILHSGLDDVWAQPDPDDSENRELFWRMSVPALKKEGISLDNILLYPDGPFTGDIADTLTNFTDGTIEDAAEE